MIPAPSDPQDALRLARESFRRFNAGDLEGFWAMPYADDLVVATDPSWPGGGEFHGIDEFRRFIGQFLEAFDEIRFEEDAEPEIVGDAAIFHGRWIGLGATSGIETASPAFFVVFRAVAGRTTEVLFFFSGEAARANALGGRQTQ